MKTWDSYEKVAEKGFLQIGVKVVLAIFVLGAIIWGLSAAFSWFGEAATVAKEEFGPRELLKKYEWFKDSAAELDKKVADISVYQKRVDGLNADYVGAHRKDWPRSDREQMSIWQAESAGVKASYNGLAAEYNSNHSKINWAFADIGSLPFGDTTPLPKDYRLYLTE